MTNGRLRERVRELMLRLKRSVVQHIPAELEACEVCGKLDCRGAEWASCEKRLASAEFIRTGDEQALARLKLAYDQSSRPAAPPPPSAGDD